MTPAERSAIELHRLFEHLGQAWQVTLRPEGARAAIEDALAEVPPEAPAVHAAMRAAASLGMRASVVARSARQVARDGDALAPLAFHHARRGWIVVVGRARRRRVRVLTAGGDAKARAMSAAELASHLGVADADEAVSWIAAEPAAPMEPMVTGGGHGHMTPAQRLRVLMRLERRDLLSLVAFAAFVGVMTLATPLAVQALVSSVAFGTLLQPIIVLSLVVVAALLFAGVLRTMQLYIAEVLQRRIFVRLVSDLAHRLPRVQRDFLDELDGSKLVNRFFDVITVQKAASILLLDGVVLALELCIGLLLIAVYSPYLLAFSVLLVVGLAIVVLPLGKGGVATAVSESWAKHHVAEGLIDIVRAPAAFARRSARGAALTKADALALEYLAARRAHFLVLLRQHVGVYALQAIVASSLLGVGGALVLSGQLTLGQLVAAELIVSAIVASLSKLGKQLESTYDLLAALDKIGHLIDVPVERVGGEELARLDRGVAVDAAGLAIAPAGVTVIERADLVVAANERVALLGPAGSGKTLLLESIVGLHEAASGRIQLDDKELRDLDLGALREQAALVPEVPEIWDGTIAENLRAGTPHVSAADVRRVLADVGLADELAALKQGIHTRILAHGAPLSHSQAVRLTLARALLQRPRLVLLDCVLDRLDRDDRDRVVALLRARDRSWTVVVATRNEAIARRFERALRMDKGRIGRLREAERGR